jgi:hypothetical protein
MGIGLKDSALDGFLNAKRKRLSFEVCGMPMGFDGI